LFSRVITFGKMIKFSHSIFALPFAFTSFITAYKIEKINFTISDVFLLVVCMVSARTAAMGFNRVADKEIDKLNPRTKNREIPSGAINTSTAIMITLFSVLVFIAASFMINSLCGFLSIPLICLLLGYSYTKRFTALAHFVLGLCLGAAPLGVWFSMTGTFHIAPILLCLGVTFWTAGFDIYYSCQDYEFDKANKLNSIPAKFGALGAIKFVRLVHIIAVVLFVLFGYFAGLGILFYCGLAAVTTILVYEAWLLRNGDLTKIDLAFFNLNGYVSILFALATALDIFVFK